MPAHGRPSPLLALRSAVLRVVCERALTVLLVLAAGCTSHGQEDRMIVSGSDCASCHGDEAIATTSPPHAQARFVTDCGACHNEKAWLPAPGFSHPTRFALIDAHAGHECSSCHEKGYLPGQVSSECVECHGSAAKEVVDPVHNGLSTDCFACHRTDAFWPARFVHSWPLQGKHTLPSCGSCHPGNPAVYERTSPECVSCHMADAERANATVIGHEAYGVDCADCHSAEAF